MILFKTSFINSDIDLYYEDLDLIFRVMFLLFIVEAYLNNNQELSRHSVGVFILELLYLLASAFAMIRKHLEKEKQQKLELEIMNHEKIAEEKIMTARKETQQLRHDIRHLISVITSDKYNSDEIEKMVENYKDMNETVLPVVTISEPVNYVLNSKREEAVKQGIDIVSSINIIENIKMDNSDLVLLLSNILDNAIKHIGQEKKIRFEIFQKNHITVIRCSNSVDLKKQNIIKEGHGFGIPTIKTITEKYNGTFDINKSDIIYEITVGLPAN